MKPAEISLIPFFGSELYKKSNLGILRLLITMFYVIILLAIIGMAYEAYNLWTMKSNYSDGLYKITRYVDMPPNVRDNVKSLAEKEIDNTETNLFYAFIGTILFSLVYWLFWYLLVWIFSGFFAQKKIS